MRLLGYKFRKYFFINEQRTTNNEKRYQKGKFVVHPKICFNTIELYSFVILERIKRLIYLCQKIAI